MSDFYSKCLKNVPNNVDRTRNEAKERRRNVLYLILAYLEEQGLQRTVETLCSEASLDGVYQICENIDLDLILQEYQSYYHVKYQKYPKILKKVIDSDCRPKTKFNSAKKTKSTTSQPSQSCEDFQFEIKQILDRKPLKLIENDSPEANEMSKQIVDQIVPNNVNIGWQQCLGLENVVEILKESCVYPIQYPELFKDLTPWRGVLLYGPPGTGKTLLAKSLASETQTTFFNVTSSAFVSKWRGDSEKMIKLLFDTAKLNAPSVIFFDEVESLMSNSGGMQHEASRRFRSEVLVQIDGIVSEDAKIFILASTNTPWALDGAILRRFDKRVLVNLPDKKARVEIFKYYLKRYDNDLTAKDFEEIGDKLQNFSGSDIKMLSKELGMATIRNQIKERLKGAKNLTPKKITIQHVKIALETIRPTVNEKFCRRYLKWEEDFGAL